MKLTCFSAAVLAAMTLGAGVSACAGDHHHHHDHGDHLAHDHRMLEEGGEPQRCGIPPVSQEEALLSDQEVKEWMEEGTEGDGQGRRLNHNPILDNFCAIIETYVHVVVPTGGTSSWDSTATTSSMDALNDAYHDMGFTFLFMSESIIEDDDWFDATSKGTLDLTQRNAVRVGGKETLNIFIRDLSADRLLGYAWFPFWPDIATGEDTATIDRESTPGGSFSNYNEGMCKLY